MNKWLARLEALEREEAAVAPCAPHCQNRQKGLLAVLAGDREADAAEPPGDPWPGEPPSRFDARRDRLLRWGWPAAEADAMAGRLAHRDAQADDRVVCAADCGHYRPGRCGNHLRAGLLSSDLGRDLAGLLQRCPGFQLEG